MSETDKLVERLESTAQLPVCPFDRRSPDYWTVGNNGEPCPVCGGTEEVDKCRGADTRVMDEAAVALRSAEARIRELEASLLASMGGKDDLQTISNPHCADQAGRSPSAGVSGAEGAIWVVHGSTGEYSDRHEWVVYAFRSEQEARAYVEFLTVKRQGIGPVGDEDEWDVRGRAEKHMREFDPNYSEDSTGTRWFIQQAVLKSSGAPSPSPSEASAATAGLDEQSSPANVSGEGEP